MGLKGGSGVSVPKMAHLCGCWREASAPLHSGPSIMRLVFLHDIVATSLPLKERSRDWGESCNIFHGLVEVAPL